MATHSTCMYVCLSVYMHTAKCNIVHPWAYDVCDDVCHITACPSLAQLMIILSILAGIPHIHYACITHRSVGGWAVDFGKLTTITPMYCQSAEVLKEATPTTGTGQQPRPMATGTGQQPRPMATGTGQQPRPMATGTGQQPRPGHWHRTAATPNGHWHRTAATAHHWHRTAATPNGHWHRTAATPNGHWHRTAATPTTGTGQQPRPPLGTGQQPCPPLAQDSSHVHH